MFVVQIMGIKIPFLLAIHVYPYLSYSRSTTTNDYRTYLPVKYDSVVEWSVHLFEVVKFDALRIESQNDGCRVSIGSSNTLRVPLLLLLLRDGH